MNVLSSAYLGNIRWFSKLCFSECVIDMHEHYVKQSFRNRCEILAPAGRTTLTVNVVKGRNDDKTAVRDARIDYSKRWQHQHRQALVSAYANSPYFDHYWPDLEPFYTKRFDFLIDLNVPLTETMLRLMGSDVRINFSDAYLEPDGNFIDLRDAISPKPRLDKPDPLFRPAPYWQVFGGAFEANLSVVDLLFCEGPRALEVIHDSIPQISSAAEVAGR